MKSRHVVPVVLYTLLGGAGGVSAGELGHYEPGLLNIRDFFVPEPGFYYAQYKYFYSTDTIPACLMIGASPKRSESGSLATLLGGRWLTHARCGTPRHSDPPWNRAQ